MRTKTEVLKALERRDDEAHALWLELTNSALGWSSQTFAERLGDRAKDLTWELWRIAIDEALA